MNKNYGTLSLKANTPDDSVTTVRKVLKQQLNKTYKIDAVNKSWSTKEIVRNYFDESSMIAKLLDEDGSELMYAWVYIANQKQQLLL